MTQHREQNHVTPPLEPQRGFNFRAALGAGAALLLALFLLQNLQSVDVNFLWFSFSTRLTWALLASAAFGVIAFAAFALLRGRKEG